MKRSAIQFRSSFLHPLALCLLSSLACGNVEQFVPPSFTVGTLEMQTDARVWSSSVTLKQVCRWSRSDNAVFASVADLVVAHMDGQAFISVKLDDVGKMLRGAGISLAAVRFTGSAACTVTRIDMPVDHATAFQQWAETTEQSKAASRPTVIPVDAQPASIAQAPAIDNGIQTLRSMLTADLANRVQVPPDSLQIQFDPRDEKLLSMTNPPFSFETAPSRLHNLGNVSWDVTIHMGRGEQSAHITAVARAWQKQVVTARPVQFGQVLRAEDLTQQRVLVDSLGDETMLTEAQAVGQEAAMDMKIGTPLTAHKVTSVPLIRDGQLVTVTVNQGNVSVQTAARALASATYGQLVRLRNEKTHDIFDAVVTGNQQAEIR